MIEKEMMIALKSLLMQEEGFRQFPYKDTVGKMTIGYGRNLDDVGISHLEAVMLLDNDINLVIDDLGRHFPVFSKLDEIRQLVLIDMAFNMGVSKLSEFRKMFASLEASDYDEASSEMLNSYWATQVNGRAERLAQIMRLGKL